MSRTDDSGTSDSLRHGIKDLAVSNADLIAQLPGPDTEWRVGTLDNSPDWLVSKLPALKHGGVLEVVGTAQQSKHHVNIYRVRRPCYEVVQQTIEDRDPILPCGHSGLSNDRDTTGVVCSFVGCDRRFVRENGEFTEVQR